MVYEIILIVIGIALVIAGYVIPAKKEDDGSAEALTREEVSNIVSEEVESAKGRIDGIVDETINYAIEKAERGMDRLSNEKMMAVSEYSDTVLDQINKSHEEVVFLYDMLNDKHENLKETVAEASRTANDVRESIKEAETKKTDVLSAVNEGLVSARELAMSKNPDDPEPDAPVVVDSVRTAQDITPKDTANASAPDKAPASSSGTAKKSDSRKRNKPVPVVRTKTITSPVIDDGFGDDIREDNDYFEEEWENLDDSIDSDGPEISFNVHSPGSRNSNERILELHKAGKSNMAIAKELGLGIGEVKLVIDLFKGQ